VAHNIKKKKTPASVMQCRNK